MPNHPRTLRELIARDEPLDLPLVALDPTLLTELQHHLSRHFLLDPPPDRLLGPVTTWAIATADPGFGGALTPKLAERLLADEPILPLHPGEDLAGHLANALQRQGHWICRVPGTFTVAYVEATAPDGSASPHRPNAFDDARFLLKIDPHGRPVLEGAWPATTRSGNTGRTDPVDEQGPPRLDPGQHKAWVMGRTAIGTELEQDALVQIAPLPVKRDASKDASRAGGPHQEDLFVIDQHGAMDAVQVDDTAIGCLVTPKQQDHEAFLAALRQDPRYRANNAYRFMTALLTRDQWKPTPR